MKRLNLLCKQAALVVPKDEQNYIMVNDFDDSTFKAFYKEFSVMDADPLCTVIPIVINSFGGQVHTLLSMLDLMDAATKPVSTIGIGKAMSCGAILLAAGTKGYRFSAPNTDIMLHEVSSAERGKTTDIEAGSKQTKRLNKFLFEYLTKKSNLKDKNYFVNQMKKSGNVDWHLSSDQFKKLGLIDHVSVPQLISK